MIIAISDIKLPPGYGSRHGAVGVLVHVEGEPAPTLRGRALFLLQNWGLAGGRRGLVGNDFGKLTIGVGLNTTIVTVIVWRSHVHGMREIMCGN